MEGGIGLGGKEEEGKKGLEGTGLNLSVNHNGNLLSASSDENLKDIFQHIRTSKTPAVINYGASCATAETVGTAVIK